jgi:hypothetical protein
VQEGGEERKDGEDVDLRDGEHFGRVQVIPVPKLVGEDGFDLIGLTLLDERIEDDDVLALGWALKQAGHM